MRRFLLAACAASLLPLAAGQALAQDSAAKGAQAGTGTTLTIALREDPDILDPTLSTTYVGRIVYAGLCDKLFDINQKLQIVPQLATGYEWADPKTLVVHLRHGVSFQDGEPLDAAAVKYTLMRNLTMKGSYRRSEINALDHVDVVDPYTVRIVLKQPSAPFLAQLADRAGMILAPKVAEKEGDRFGLHPVCAGPFRFVKRVPQDRIVLERFPDYWNKQAIHFDRVIYRPMPNSASRLANLQAGAVDLSEYVEPTNVATVRKDPKLHLVISDSLEYMGITINLAHGPRANTPLGHDPRVRQAFALSIDRAALTQVVFNGMYTPTAQAIPHSSPYYDTALKVPARDVARARALLKEAGVKLPVQVHLMIPNTTDMRQVGEVIQAMAREAGFDVKLDTVEFATSLSTARQGNFESYLIGWSGRIDPDGNTYSFLHTDGAQNDGAYSNAMVDHDLDQARLVTDVAKRRDLYADMFRQESQDLPIIYLYNQKNIVGMSAKLQGFQPIPDGMIRLQGLHWAK